jgi:ornithine cyclodeaminase
MLCVVSGLRILSADDVRRSLPMPAAIEAMREAFGALAAGRADVPVRTSVPCANDGTLLVMSGRVSDPAALGAKLVSVFPGNAASGQPVVQATVLLLNAESGAPYAVLDGTSLTAIRTGAASGLATDLLARKDARRVAILGSGVQARTQLEAVCCVRSIESVAVWSRTRANAERFAEEQSAERRAQGAVRVAASPDDAVRNADIVCCATSSSEPVLSSADVADGVHVNAVGSFMPGMREFEPALLGRARVVVDQREAAMAEAGEVIVAINGGLVRRDSLIELGAIVNGAARGRASDDEITVFKSVGLAVQDLVAGARAVRNLVRD